MTFLVFVWYPEWGKNMVLLEAREGSDLGGKRDLHDPLFLSPEESFSHGEILFERAYFRKGKKAAGGGGGASSNQLFLFPDDISDFPQLVTSESLRKARYEELTHQLDALLDQNPSTFQGRKELDKMKRELRLELYFLELDAALEAAGIDGHTTYIGGQIHGGSQPKR